MIFFYQKKSLTVLNHFAFGIFTEIIVKNLFLPKILAISQKIESNTQFLFENLLFYFACYVILHNVNLYIFYLSGKNIYISFMAPSFSKKIKIEELK